MTNDEGLERLDPLLEDAEFAHLLKHAREGELEALDELVRTCHTYLLLVANEQLGPALQAKLGPSDVVQSALFQAQQHIGAFQGENKEQLLGWLRAILKNVINTAHRRFTTEKRDLNRELANHGSSASPTEGIVDNHPSPFSEAVLGEEAVALRLALSNLPPDYRRVVLLRNWEQLAFDEVARRMERSTDSAKKLWSRAMRRLKAELEAKN